MGPAASSFPGLWHKHPKMLPGKLDMLGVHLGLGFNLGVGAQKQMLLVTGSGSVAF